MASSVLLTQRGMVTSSGFANSNAGRGTINGIGLVNVMGRDAGFIAAGASVVSQEVNFTLVPEIRFPLEGDGGFLDALEERIRKRGHAVVVVAEGAGQHLIESTELRRDKSGNVLYEDVGLFLRQKIREHFAEGDLTVDLKYFDPSYHIRNAAYPPMFTTESYAIRWGGMQFMRQWRERQVC